MRLKVTLLTATALVFGVAAPLATFGMTAKNIEKPAAQIEKPAILCETLKGSLEAKLEKAAKIGGEAVNVTHACYPNGHMSMWQMTAKNSTIGTMRTGHGQLAGKYEVTLIGNDFVATATEYGSHGILVHTLESPVDQKTGAPTKWHWTKLDLYTPSWKLKAEVKYVDSGEASRTGEVIQRRADGHYADNVYEADNSISLTALKRHPFDTKVIWHESRPTGKRLHMSKRTAAWGEGIEFPWFEWLTMPVAAHAAAVEPEAKPTVEAPKLNIEQPAAAPTTTPPAATATPATTPPSP